MSEHPWEVDRTLTTDMAKAAVGSAFPGTDLTTFTHLGSGWDFDVFLTADGWVFRFPRRAELEALFERERPILELVSSALPDAVAVPWVERIGRPAAGFPYCFAGHRFLAGAPADQVAPEHRPVLAQGIGTALGALHSIPPDAGRSAGLAPLDRSEAGRREWFARGLSGIRELRGTDPLIDRGIAWVEDVDDPLRRLDAPLRVIHHDLSPEHLVADPATGRLVGVIDWTDAILGDPARDFVTLVAFGGWEFVEQVLAHYPDPLDAGFMDRLDFMARLLTVMWLGEARSRRDDDRRHLDWVRHAFDDRARPQRG